jgi:general secretion pathway protein G
VVVAIIATLSAIAMPPLMRALKQTEQGKAESDIRTIENMIYQYQLEHGEYPESLDDLGLAVPVDPWGNPYQYLRIAGAGNKGKGHWRKDRFLVPLNSDFDLYSMGPDGRSSPPLTAEASRDDIVRAANGTFVGPAEEY